jgi:serine/threonine protein kinase
MKAATGLSPGTVLAKRYEILREIGRGERSIVFEALDSQRDCRVAVKLLSPAVPIAHLMREQLRRDAEALRAVDHAGILRPIELLEAGFSTLIVTELVEGVDLGTRVSTQGPLNPHDLAVIGRSAAEALAAAHARGLLHRNVKPQNIFLAETGETLLADLGCAGLDGQEAPLDERNSTRSAFVSPELAEGRHADARADVYALGVTLYYALVGELPQETRNEGGLAEGFHPAKARPDVPKWLDTIVAKATCFEPGDRIETLDRMARALDEEGLPAGGAGAAREAYLADCCILCREPGTLGRSICPHCEDPKRGESDTLIMLVPASSQAATEAERIRKLRGLTGAPSDEHAVRRVALGKQPLVKLSRTQAQRVAQRLSSLGFDTRLVGVDATWSELPAWLIALALVPMGLGVARVLVGDVLLFGIGIASGLLLLPVGHGLLRHPPLIPDATGARPSPALAARVAEVMSEILGGEARKLLSEILRLGRDISVRLAGCSDSGAAVEKLAGVALCSCDAARELAALDPLLEALMLHGEHRFEPPPGLLESRAGLSTVRSRLVQGLLEATATLSAIRGVEILDLDEISADLRAIDVRLTEEVEAERLAVKQAFSLFPLRSTPAEEI